MYFTCEVCILRVKYIFYVRSIWQRWLLYKDYLYGIMRKIICINVNYINTTLMNYTLMNTTLMDFLNYQKQTKKNDCVITEIGY